MPKPLKPKTAAERKSRVQQILVKLDEMYPNATCALLHSQRLGAAGGHHSLGAVHGQARQRSDARAVRQIPHAQDFAAVQPEVLAQDIRCTGFFNNKAKSHRGRARKES